VILAVIFGRKRHQTGNCNGPDVEKATIDGRGSSKKSQGDQKLGVVQTPALSRRRG